MRRDPSVDHAGVIGSKPDGWSDTPLGSSTKEEVAGAVRKIGARDDVWVNAAYDALRSLALQQETVNSDDVWQELTRRKVESPRAMKAIMGAVFRRAATARIIEDRGSWVQSQRVQSDDERKPGALSNHRRITNWFSRIHRPGAR